MKKNLIALIAGAAALCMMTAGCGSQSTETTTASAAATEAAAAATTAAAAAAQEEEQAWKKDDTSYLSGITASDYVELPDDYKHQSYSTQALQRNIMTPSITLRYAYVF